MSQIEVRNSQGRFVAGHAPTSPGRPKRETERMILDAIANAVSVRIMPELVKRTIGEGK